MNILASENSATFHFSAFIAAKAGGSDAAVIFQQISYWTGKSNCGRLFDGVRWIYKSYKQWQKELPWNSIRQIRLRVEKLRELGIIKAERLTVGDDDKHCLWYTIDHEGLEKLRNESLNHQYFSSDRGTTLDAHVEGSDVEGTGSDVGVTSSIYTENTLQRITAENNNNTAAVAAFSKESVFEDEERNDFSDRIGIPILSSSSQPQPNQSINGQIDHEDQKVSPAARDNNCQEVASDEEKAHIYKLEDIALCGIEINKQLDKIVRDFTEDELRESLDCYEQNIERKKVIPNPQGWLVECLRGEWWKNSPKRVERRLEEAKILETLARYGYHFDDPEPFFAHYWADVDNDSLHELEEIHEVQRLGDRVGYLLINEHGLSVCRLNEDFEYELVPYPD